MIRLREKAGQTDQAIALARRATSIAPLHETAWCDLIRLLVDKGEKGEALRAAKAAQGTFEREGMRVPEAILRLAYAVGASSHESRGVAVPHAIDPASTPFVSTLASGTFTILLAEGEAIPLTAMAATGQQAGGQRLAGPEGTLQVAFGSGRAAVAAAVAGMPRRRRGVARRS